MSLSLSGTFSCDSSHFSYDPAPDDTGWESPSDCGADAVFGAQYGDLKSATVPRVSSRLLAPTQSSQAKSRCLAHRRAAADGGAMGRDPFSTSSQPRKAKAGAPAAGKAHGTAAAAHSHQHVKAPACAPRGEKVSAGKSGPNAARNAAKGGQSGQGRRMSDASENLALQLAKQRNGVRAVGGGVAKKGDGGGAAAQIPRGGRLGSAQADRAPSVCRHALVASRKPLVAGAAGNAVQGRVAAGGVKPRHRLADGKGAPGGGGRIPAQDAPDGGKGLRGHTAAGSGSVKWKNEKRVVGNIGAGTGGRGASAEQTHKARREAQPAAGHTQQPKHSLNAQDMGSGVAAKGLHGCGGGGLVNGTDPHTAPRTQHAASPHHPPPPPPDQLALTNQPTMNHPINQTTHVLSATLTLPPSLLPFPLAFPSPCPSSSSGSADDADMPWAEWIGDVRGMEQDVQYVRHALLASGFLSDALPPLFSPYLPINPAFFHHLEAAFLMRCCAHTTHDPSLVASSLPAFPLAVPASYHEERRQRMLLFDAVNEALGRRLAAFLPRPPWSPPPARAAPRRRPLGMELVQEVWSEIHSWPVASTEEVYTVLDESARRDLWRGTERWREEDVAEEESGVVFDVEGALLEQLLGEVCLEYLLVEQRRAAVRSSVHGVVKAQIMASGFVSAAHVKAAGRNGVVALLGPACPTAVSKNMLRLPRMS
ncbi:hypothetical protein CLOM_g1595 [Closterium sp. NIES-68]|nr:hypothetical protein CLOM_g1595 [Closterium sp. NIES-68]